VHAHKRGSVSLLCTSLYVLSCLHPTWELFVTYLTLNKMINAKAERPA